MKKYFDLVTAVYAFLAAVVLFWAASVRIPPLESYKDFKPPSELDFAHLTRRSRAFR
jgi:hypothetical protein